MEKKNVEGLLKDLMNGFSYLKLPDWWQMKVHLYFHLHESDKKLDKRLPVIKGVWEKDRWKWRGKQWEQWDKNSESIIEEIFQEEGISKEE